MGRLLLILLLLSGGWGFGQLSLEVDRYRESYPNAHSIQVAQEKVIHIGLEDDDLKIVEEYYEEDLYLDENATNASKGSLTFSSFYQLVDIEAYTLVPENGKYQKYEVQDFREKDEINESFHDDLKSVNFIYPNLNPGGKTVLKYSREVKNPRFLNPFYFGSTYPISRSRLTIIADNAVTLHFKEFNTENIPLTYNKSVKRGKTIHTWETGNIDEYEFESGSPSFRSMVPHLIPIVSSYSVNGGKVQVLEAVDDLYAWYYSLISDINREAPDAALVDLVNNLTNGKDTPLEKVRAIYYWTQEHIKYIDFEAGLGGFIPREANEVFHKKYGDCKDNSSLLYKMLEISGLKGRITWIGTRRIPYRYDEVPTPLVDDHMILSFEDGTDTYFLDATGRYTSLESPPSFIQGKEALISLGEGRYRIAKVPVIPASQSGLRENTRLSLKNNLLTGKSESEVLGYKKIDWFYALEEEDSAKDIQNWYQGQLQKGNNTFLIKSLEERNRNHYDKSLEVDYDFEIANYAKSIGDEIYINLNLNRDLLNYKIPETRVTPYEYEYKESYAFVTDFDVPEGYKVDYLPENSEIQSDLIRSSITYSLEGGTIHYEHHISLDALQFEMEDQASANALIKKMEKAYNEVVVLKKI